MSCDRIVEALRHLPEKQLTGRNRLEAGNTPTTPDRRLRYLVGAIAAPMEAEVGGTHQKPGAATTGGTLQFLTSRTFVRISGCFTLLLSQDDSGSSLRCQVPDFKEMLPGD
jgi:hypothetical protein